MEKIEQIKLLFNTGRYLKPGQVYWRLVRRLQSNRLPADPVPSYYVPVNRICPFPAGSPKMTGPMRFLFLNEEGQIREPDDWNSAKKSKLWLYNLHYFEDMTCEAPETRVSWHREYVENWIAHNRPFLGNGWEPYTTSLRIVNWIKWHISCDGLSEQAIESLYVQARHLYSNLEYHLLGNHLFANAKALLLAGLFFGGGETLDGVSGWPSRFYSKALEIIARELPEQVRDDGSHFEQSLMYHALFLEDLLDIINASMAYGRPVPEQWNTMAGRMMRYLRAMTHPDGGLGFFNDAADGIAKTTEQLSEYLSRLGLDSDDSTFSGAGSRANLQVFADSGMVSASIGAWSLIIDCGPIGPDYLPGHAHSDTLSFESSLHGTRLLVNSGTSIYGYCPERLRQRSTMAHNTLRVDHQDQSEVWHGFRVARRARPGKLFSYQDGEGIHVQGSHDGYRRFSSLGRHRRDWSITKDALEVSDLMEGSGAHDIEIYWRFHPDFYVSIDDDSLGGMARHRNTGIGVRFAFINGRAVLTDSTYHPGFGLTEPCRLIVVERRAFLPSVFKARFEVVS